MRMEERKSENETTDFTDFHRCHFELDSVFTTYLNVSL